LNVCESRTARSKNVEAHDPSKSSKLKIRILGPKKPAADALAAASGSKTRGASDAEKGRPKELAKGPSTAPNDDDPKDKTYAPPKRLRKLSESTVEEIELDSHGEEVVQDLPAVRVSQYNFFCTSDSLVSENGGYSM